MGTEVAWVPLVMAAVGTAASVYNTQQTAKKQDNALAAQIESASKKEREAGDRTRELIDKTAQSNPDAERQSALGQYVQALRAGGGAATAGLAAPKGAASSRFANEAQDAALGVTNYGEDQAGLFSTIDAAGRMREREGIARGRAATDLDAIARRARAADFLLGLKTNSIRRNPWIDAGASALTSYGTSQMGNTAGTAGALKTDAGADLGGSIFGTSQLYRGGRTA